jgi:threonine synthase
MASDEEIVDGIKLLAESEGIFAETAGGVAVACLKKLIASGVINTNEETVLFITGAGLKTIEAVKDEMNPAIMISPNAEEFMVEFNKLG